MNEIYYKALSGVGNEPKTTREILKTVYPNARSWEISQKMSYVGETLKQLEKDGKVKSALHNHTCCGHARFWVLADAPDIELDDVEMVTPTLEKVDGFWRYTGDITRAVYNVETCSRKQRDRILRTLSNLAAQGIVERSERVPRYGIAWRLVE